MASCVSKLNNAELDSLLKDFFGDSASADKEVNEIDQNIFDDSDIAGICNLAAGTMDMDAIALTNNKSAEDVLDQ